MPAPSVHVISITPFAADGTLDEPGLHAHLRRMAAAGVGVYVGGGGSGEGFTLDEGETRRVLEIAAEEVGGRSSVRAMGIEPRTASQMIDYVRAAESAGVDACQIYSLDPGHGHRPSVAEAEGYFVDVLEAGDFPAVLSTHQSVGYRLPPSVLGSLVERFPQIVGINCSHGDVGYLTELVDAVGGQVEVHVGGPAQGLAAFALGATGFLASEANLAPVLCQRVIERFVAGDAGATFEAFGTLLRLHHLLYANGGIRVTKAVLERLGLPGGTVRRPQQPPSEHVVDAVLERIGELGIAEIEGWANV